MPLALSSTVASPRRWRAAGLRLALSYVVAAATAALIFLLWFSSPLGAVTGGATSWCCRCPVDVIAGPALTFVAASRGKTRTELRRDLAVIALLQLSAFGYGTYVIGEARPAVLSFEVDRFRVVSDAEVHAAALPESPETLRCSSSTGPRQIAVVKPVDPEQAIRSKELGLSGIDLSMDPCNWPPYDAHAPAAWRTAKPLQEILDKYPATTAEATKIAIIGYLPIDGFL